jgi:hypothetical protein
MRLLLAKLSQQKAFFVLRGGIALAHYVDPAPRPIDDLDLLAPLTSFDAELLRQNFRSLVTERADTQGDSQTIEIASEETIWADTPWPGLRFQLSFAKEETLQVDIGFGDPLVGGPVEVEILPDQPVSTCRPETLFAWKVHGLFEHGPGKWRAKDLYDIVLLERHVSLDETLLREAIAVAFESRDCSFDIASRFLSGEFGQSRGSRRKWRQFVGRRELPETEHDLAQVLERARAFLRPLLQ